LVEKPEGESSLGRQVGVYGRIMHILKKDFKEQGLQCTDWIHLAQSWDQLWALVNKEINL
jgi:hypothetical protein